LSVASDFSVGFENVNGEEVGFEAELETSKAGFAVTIAVVDSVDSAAAVVVDPKVIAGVESGLLAGVKENGLGMLVEAGLNENVGADVIDSLDLGTSLSLSLFSPLCLEASVGDANDIGEPTEVEVAAPGEPKEKPANGFAAFAAGGGVAADALRVGTGGEATSLEVAPTPRNLRCSCNIFNLETGVFICLCDLSTGALSDVGAAVSVSALS
jgi:hypothetical protein